ncbi:MAG: transcription termination factor Rho [Lachnospiraceae bacterium]|nr:transcription termination factor Rho [Lachnospiraceae bacterium]
MREKLESLSLAVLKELAKEKKIKRSSSMKKQELVEALLLASTEEDEAATVSSKKEKSEEKSDKTDKAKKTAGSKKADDAEKTEKAKKTEKSEKPVKSEKPEKTDKSEKHEKHDKRKNKKADEEEGKSAEGSEEAVETEPFKPVDGILEVLTDGYGFVRCENYLPGSDDVYVSPAQIRKLNLKTGDIIKGTTKRNNANDKFGALQMIESVNGYSVEDAIRRPSFENLTPIFPDKRIHLERANSSVAMRIVDLISPIGKGQRGMIVSQPKAGKTTLLKEIAKSVKESNPDMHIIILLIDERPEEVTDIKEAIQGKNAEVIYSTFDELPEHHKRVSEMVIERAKRLVEHKQDVMILLDSITRLSRAYNLTVPPSGRTLSGGLDPAALHMPKRFFGAARNMREGGSLTILATALVETGSKMDDVVFEEFKGTGNMELVLDRKLSEKRVFPAIDIAKSGTRREDKLLTDDELRAVDIMRKGMNGMRSDEAVENILNLFARTKSNADVVAQVGKRRML